MDQKKIDELPRNNLPHSGAIAVVGVCSVAFLVSLVPAFNAYYDGMFNRAVGMRLSTYDDRADVQRSRAEWAEAQRSGRMPLDQAMAQLGERGRRAFPQISPQSGGEMNLAPLTGWAQNEQDVPTAVVRAQEAAAERARVEAEQAAAIEAAAAAALQEATEETVEEPPAAEEAPRRRRRRAPAEGAAEGAAPTPPAAPPAAPEAPPAAEAAE